MIDIPHGIKIVLGSSSKARKMVMDRLGLKYEIMPPDIDEKAIRKEDPDELVLTLAEAKGEALVKKVGKPSLIISADTVVMCNGEMREKPADKEEAERFFKSYVEFPAESHTGLVVTNTSNNKRAKGVDVARIYYNEMPNIEFRKMLEKGDVLNAAGAFLAEDEISKPYIKRIEGTRDSLSGLPLSLLEKLIKEVL